jgi:hypothetical protein
MSGTRRIVVALAASLVAASCSLWLDLPPKDAELEDGADAPDTSADTGADPDAPVDTTPADTGVDTEPDTELDTADDTLTDPLEEDAPCTWSPTHVEQTIAGAADFTFTNVDGGSDYDLSFYGSVCTGFGDASRAEYIVEFTAPGSATSVSIQTTGFCDLSEDSSLAVVTTDTSCAPTVVGTRCDECSYEATWAGMPVEGGRTYWLFIENNNLSTDLHGHFYLTIP